MFTSGGALAAERVRELYGTRAAGAYVIAPLITAIAALQAVLVVAPEIAPLRAGAWVGLIALVQVLTVLLVRRFHRAQPEDHELPTWARRRMAAEALHGVAWAAVIPLVYVPGNPITLMAVVALLAGMSGGMSAALSVHMPTMWIFLAGMLGPAMGFLILMRTGAIELYAMAIIFAAGVLGLANGLRTAKLYEEAMRLRLGQSAQLEARRRLQEAAEEGRRLAEEGRRLAEEVSIERVRFFGAASHDLRQPVHALGLYASLLQQDPPQRERREMIKAIGACVDSLDRLFKAILGMAHASRSDAEAHVAAFPLQELFERVELLLGPEARQRRLSLRVRQTHHWVSADAGMIERIVVNLAQNALRYTESGGVLVAARRRGERIELVVADTGVGLEAAEIPRIFDPFYRVGSPHRERDHGFGLGLATVGQLCASGGLPIEVRSRPGRGSIFRVGIPRAPAAHRPGLEAAPPRLPLRQHVLLVEDDPLVVDALVRLLQAWGVTVQTCRTGAEALQILAARADGESWHALLDYRLPGDLNGLDLAARIQADPKGEVAVSMLTGEADPSLFEAAKALGLTVLQKPVSPIRLRALLARQEALAAA